MILDHINAGFEAVGALVRALDCFKLYSAKKYAGVHPASTIFFFSWGLFNSIYYPSLNQPWSFAFALVLCSMNAFWLGLAFCYRRNNHV